MTVAAGKPTAATEPHPIRVRAAAGDGRPISVDGVRVESITDDWLVEDRWWDDELRRRYWEVVTCSGRRVVVFRDLEDGRWYSQGR